MPQGEQVKLSETESLREASPSLGARRASCRRGPLSVPPTSVSSDHLLVFPGTLPNPGTCPLSRMPKPLAFAGPCTGLWASLASVVLLLPCGRADTAGGYQVRWGPLQDGHGTTGVGCQVSVGGRSIAHSPAWCPCHTACELVCVPLPSLHASLPCS